MTNVKLKLMFYLLNALLTLDFATSRPYSDVENDTEAAVSLSRNTTARDRDGGFNIPVDSDADTLIAAEEEENSRKMSRSDAKREMESIMDAEQNRDENILKKVIKEGKNNLNISKGDADALNKQLKVSSPVLEDIIDAETGREESLTHIIQFRPEPELEELPSFEFLVAVKPNNTNILVKVNRSVEFKDLDEILRDNGGNGSEPFKKIDYVELVEVVKQNGENKSAYNLANMTGHEIENDNAPDTILSVFAGFTDVQTLFLACFGTLLPLLTILFIMLIVRCVCRRWCRRRVPSSVSDSSEHKHAHHQLKSSTGEENNGGATSPDGNSGPANGSIITMTLKNNHLIVETEERNDITKNGRETKMKYSPGNDGIFVVEVQQSAVYRPNNKSPQNSPPHYSQLSINQAQIHRVPEELETKDEKASVTDSSNPEESSERESVRMHTEKPLALSSTGLSISDLSISSIGSHNLSYSYGNQGGYEHGHFGYPIYAGYDIPKRSFREGITSDSSREPLISKTPTDPDKPVVTAAILKQDSIIGNDILKGAEYCIEGCSDGPLLSDILAREASLQKLHDEMDKTHENGTAAVVEQSDSPKKALNRADSLPVRFENEPVAPVADRNSAMETIVEHDLPQIHKEALKSKRASLPIIQTEMYESVKDALMSSGSPKFERLNNDSSPGAHMENTPPMITITEENDTAMNTEEMVS